MAGLGVALAGCQRNEFGHLTALTTGDLSLAPAPRAPFDARQQSACGPGGPTAAGRQVFARQPYLQKVTDSAAEILWVSSSPAPATVAITRADGSGVAEATAQVDEAASPPGGSLYVARLENLDAGTTLCYRITGDTGPLTERTGFRTAPAPASADPVRFVAFGDVGARTGDQYAVLGQLATVEFDLALVTGDLAYDNGEPGELEDNFFSVYADLMARTAFFPTTGNHDYKTGDARPFRDAFALFENGGPEGLERWYSFDWGNVHVAVLDTEKVDTPQLQWLEKDLAGNTLPWVIVVGHKPPYSSGTHGPDDTVREHIVPILGRYNVDLALFGHEHHYERTVPVDRTIYVITGGAGRGTRPVGESDHTAFAVRVAHFVYVIVEGDMLRFFAIDATGHDFDTLELRKPG